MTRALFALALTVTLTLACERTPGTSREVSPPSTLAPDPGRTPRSGPTNVAPDVPVPDGGDETLDDPDASAAAERR